MITVLQKYIVNGLLNVIGTATPSNSITILEDGTMTGFYMVNNMGNWAINQAITGISTIEFIEKDSLGNIVGVTGAINIIDIPKEAPIVIPPVVLVVSNVHMEGNYLIATGTGDASHRLWLSRNDVEVNSYPIDVVNGWSINVFIEPGAFDISIFDKDINGNAITACNYLMVDLIPPVDPPVSPLIQIINDIQLISEVNNVALITLYIRQARRVIDDYVDYKFADSELDEISEFIIDLVIFKLKDDVKSESLGDYSVTYKENVLDVFIIKRLRALKIKKGRLIEVW